jgi:hypothetical protein
MTRRNLLGLLSAIGLGPQTPQVLAATPGIEPLVLTDAQWKRA